jgi:hypothetical protein
MIKTRQYDKTELFDILDGLTIEKSGDLVLTKFQGRVIKSVGVSDRYEIFDFSSYVKKFINDIESQYDIKSYKIRFVGGIQEIELYSDEVVVSGKTFTKTLYILSSSDRTRRLNINFGLKSNSFSVIRENSTNLSKKHLTGLSNKVDETINLDATDVNKLMEIIESFQFKTIKMSNVQKIILGEDPKATDFNKFDALKTNLRWNTGLRKELTGDQLNMLAKKSKGFRFEANTEKDFFVDAFLVLEQYLRNFSGKDSHIVRVLTLLELNLIRFLI